MKAVSFRLKPNCDLYLELQEGCKDWKAAYILTCVGNLSQVRLRLAGVKKEVELDGPFEIVSLVGTCCPTGLHLHISLSDSEGRLIGGHLKSGSYIETTAEIVIGELEGQSFERIHDEETGYAEP